MGSDPSLLLNRLQVDRRVLEIVLAKVCFLTDVLNGCVEPRPILKEPLRENLRFCFPSRCCFENMEFA